VTSRRHDEARVARAFSVEAVIVRESGRSSTPCHCRTCSARASVNTGLPAFAGN